jgi:hypothetical protein
MLMEHSLCDDIGGKRNVCGMTPLIFCVKFSNSKVSTDYLIMINIIFIHLNKV